MWEWVGVEAWTTLAWLGRNRVWKSHWKKLKQTLLNHTFYLEKKLQLTRTKKLTNFTAKKLRGKTSTKLDSNQTLVITIFLTPPLLILMKDHKYINEHTKKAL